MSLASIRAAVEALEERERKQRRLQEAIAGTRAGRLDGEAARDLTRYLLAYIERSVRLLDSMASLRDATALPAATLLYERTLAYWNLSDDYSFDREEVGGYADDAYFTSVVWERIARAGDTRAAIKSGASLVGEDNRVMRVLLGQGVSGAIERDVRTAFLVADRANGPGSMAMAMRDPRGRIELFDAPPRDRIQRLAESVGRTGLPGVGVPILSRSSSRRFEGDARSSGAPAQREPADALPDVPRAKKAHVYQVAFGTNRAVVPSNSGRVGFLNRRDELGHVHYGWCDVLIPRYHRLGSVGSAWWKRWARLEFEDDHVRVLKTTVAASADEFSASLRAALGPPSKDKHQILLFVHGYNVDFEGAAIRAAQIGFDLKFAGITAFFSWPSHADVVAYPADLESIGSSEEAIAAFVERLAEVAGAERVHVIAHSMGNRGFLRALQRLAAKLAAGSGIRLGQTILAAPDVDVALFTDLAARLEGNAVRTTMYTSREDIPLAISKWFQQSPRAGRCPPVVVMPHIDTVDVSDLPMASLGHGFVADAHEILTDMGALLRHNEPPASRMRLRQAETSDGDTYWVLKE